MFFKYTLLISSSFGKKLPTFLNEVLYSMNFVGSLKALMDISETAQNELHHCYSVSGMSITWRKRAEIIHVNGLNRNLHCIVLL